MRSFASAFLALALLLPPAGQPLAAATADAALVTRIETYLNTLTSVQADFVQLSSDGRFAQGKLYLARPNKVRFDYAPPARLQIYANGSWLKFVDTRLETVTQVPLDRTVAGVLVQDKVKLSGSVKVTGVKREKGEITLSLVEANEPDAGELIMVFRDDPLRLTRWTIVDAQGIETEVSLVEPAFNGKIDPTVFDYDDKRFDHIDD